MNTKRILRRRASASLSADFGAIAFEFDDGSAKAMSKPMPAARFATVIAVLESSQAAFFTQNDDNTFYVSTEAGAPPV